MIPGTGTILALGALAVSATITGLLIWQNGELGDRNNELRARYNQSQEQVKIGNERITKLQREAEENVARAAAYQRERTDDQTRYQLEIRRLKSKERTTEKAVKEHPFRVSRILIYQFARLMRERCRAAGGSRETCKIEILESGAAGSGPAGKR